ncbi:cytosine-specific methyltransferase [Candidatus Kuenenia stuttgartiensis]|uniref:Cytosine-specific methyltransferase n=1 Tax=Kuenenia stuttgartiensis TaxID=174633 RepID=A0A6G7GY35_KUEST|nr:MULTISPECIES: DNA (cytosine-5-)-methyltransferase [Kuenenia]MCZ7621640.1 DNA cytosine methyltransferase [Candidatus Kuenenia sp.]QII14262.1 cytosine-specific methyltransferase [Candidatus Kuenenia stuttgartiensis]
MRYIDLFAGAGGFSEGFKRAGFEPVAFVEVDPAACFTLKTRHSFHYLKENNKLDIYIKYLKGEINREQLYSIVPSHILESVINLSISDENNSKIFQIVEKLIGRKDIDVIVGGPPCQAYSLVGRARDRNGMRDDPRNYLYIQYGKFLKKYSPKLFVFENVTGLLSAEKGKHFKNIQDDYRKLGYVVEHVKVEAKEFGVLQNRKRVIIIGWKKDLNFSFGRIKEQSSEEYEVGKIFKDLPKLSAGEGKDKYCNYVDGINDYLRFAKIRNGFDVLTQHITRPHTEQDKEIYRIAVEKWKRSKERLDYNDLPERLKTHKNRNAFLDRFKVVADNVNYSQTVVAHIAKDGHYYIHPDIEQNRSISVREAARLQSFPDDYYFEGVKEGKSRTAAFKQIGNAVPPLMAEKIAAAVKYLLPNG